MQPLPSLPAPLRAVAIGRESWRAEMSERLRSIGLEVTGSDAVSDVATLLDSFDIAFIDLEAGDPLRVVANLWWVERDLPAVLCGEDCAADFNRAATDAGIVVVTPAVPPAERLRALVNILTGALRKDTADRSRAVGVAMGSLCELTVGPNDQQPGTFADAVVQIVTDLFRADVVSLLIADENDALITIANIGLENVVGQPARGGGPGEYVYKTGIARLIIGDATQAPTQMLSSSNAKASMIVPVFKSDQSVRGVLTVAKRDEHALFAPRDLELCTSVATLLGQLLGRSDAARESRRLQQQLETSDKLTVLGELAAGVVHDVAAPLGAVRSNVETLISYLAELRPLLEASEEVTPGVGPILEDLPALLCETYEGLTVASNVIRQMKQVVHLGSTAHSEEVDISATVDSAIRMLRSRVQTPVVIVADDHCHIRGIAIEMLQVLTNLITNANDACVDRRQSCQQRGEAYRPRIEVATRHADGHVVISVADNGIGMSPEVMHKMWEQLFTTKPQGLGTGLGMSVVRRIVREHGGEIEVLSTPGHGSEFRLVMPASAAVRNAETATEVTDYSEIVVHAS